ncbi:hypothetical protein D9M72_528180 [compost metagenome]
MQRLRLIERDLFDDVGIAVDQLKAAGRHVADDANDDLFQRRLSACVVFVAVEHDALVALPGGDTVGPAAGGVLGKPGLRHIAVRFMLHHLGIDDRCPGDGERRDERRERRRQMKSDSLRIDDLDLLQHRERVGRSGLQLHQPVEAEFDGGGVDW